MDVALRQLVQQRGNARCEFCHLPEEYSFHPFQVDHIIAEKHGGRTVAENLAWSCFYCNTYKGPCISSWNEEKQDVVRLFNPRRDDWSEHFEWNGPILVPKTDIGDGTIRVLFINHPDAVAVRRLLLEYGEMLG